MIIFLYFYFQCIVSYEIGDIIQLPEPQKNGGRTTLNEALNNRKSSRDFDNTKK